MLLSFVAVLLVPWLSNFFEVYVQPERDTAIAVAFGLGGALLVSLTARVTDRLRRA
jgi:hypothetical protein